MKGRPPRWQRAVRRHSSLHVPCQTSNCRSLGYGSTPRYGRRFRNHGAELIRGQHCPGASGQYRCHRCGPHRPDSHLRIDFRRPLQPRGDTGRRARSGIPWRETPVYLAAQICGAIAGTLAAHAMFQLPAVSISQHIRSGPSQIFSEFVATFGLLSVIWGCSRLRSNTVAFAVGCYIVAAYWFTASTSFANPAVTIARSLTDTFSGIRPADVPGFLVGQLLGALAATLLFRWLVPGLKARAKEVVVPHNSESGKS